MEQSVIIIWWVQILVALKLKSKEKLRKPYISPAIEKELVVNCYISDPEREYS